MASCNCICSFVNFVVHQYSSQMNDLKLLEEAVSKYFIHYKHSNIGIIYVYPKSNAN